MLTLIRTALMLFIASFSFTSAAELPPVQKSIEYNMQTNPLISNSQMVKIARKVLQETNVDDSPKNSYYIKKIQLKYTQRNNPYLLVYLQHRFLSMFTVIRINLNSQLQVASIVKQYKLTPQDTKTTQSTFVSHCPAPNTKFLFAAPFPIQGTQSVQKAYEIIYPLAVKKYGHDNVKVLIDKDDTLKNFSNYLICPNLEGVFSIAGHAEIGQSFVLYDDNFDYTFFAKNASLLNYRDTLINFITCYMFDNTSPGMCESITKLSPKNYTSGITPLLYWGGPETYACFWQHILGEGAEPTKALLNQCARENDPTVPNSISPLYIIGAKNWDEGDDTYYPATITTNLQTYQITTSETYLRLHFAQNEQVEKITMQVGNKILNCPENPDLFYHAGLNAAEFMLLYDESKQACNIMHLTVNGMPAFPTGYSVYGLFPEEPCQSDT